MKYTEELKALKWPTGMLMGMALLFSYFASAQRPKQILDNMPTQHRTITTVDHRYEVEVYEQKKRPKTESSSYYFWTEGNRLDSTLGNYSGLLLHGEFQKFDKQGRLVSKGNFEKGQKQDQWMFWTSSGNLLTVHYKDGKKEGKEIKYNPGGKVISEYTYKKGMLNGQAWALTEDGQREAFVFVDGKRQGFKEAPKPVEIVPLIEEPKEPTIDQSVPDEQRGTKKRKLKIKKE